MMEKLLTPAAVAELLSISTRQLKDLADAGEIASVNIGLGMKRPTRRYRLEDINSFVESRTNVASRPGRLTAIALPVKSTKHPKASKRRW